MIATNQQFTGLPMPVFTAFGWAEENAVKYAMTQLELFIKALYNRLPREIHTDFPYFGVDHASQTVYLATDEEITGDTYISFYARPNSLQMVVNFDSEGPVGKSVKAMDKDPAGWRQLLSDLGPGWTLRVQQFERNSANGTRSHYKDIFKDEIANLDSERAAEVASTAVYLYAEDSWDTAIYLTYRVDAERASAMGDKLVDFMNEQLKMLIPVLQFMTGQARRAAARAKSARATQPAPEIVPEETGPEVIQPDLVDQFTHVTELKALHIRRGFINLTPQHWPFFAENARTTVREIVVNYGGSVDKNSTVWRLVPNDMARVVLSESVQRWLEDNFEPDDSVRVTARKLEGDKIHVTLSSVR